MKRPSVSKRNVSKTLKDSRSYTIPVFSLVNMNESVSMHFINKNIQKKSPPRKRVQLVANNDATLPEILVLKLCLLQNLTRNGRLAQHAFLVLTWRGKEREQYIGIMRISSLL